MHPRALLCPTLFIVPVCVRAQGVENMVKLNNLNEPTILHNLRCRYQRMEIYTYVGTILIAVNPFKALPLYTPAILDSYREKVR